MDATSFEINALFPPDARYAETLRELAVHAARYAGCRGHDADAFGKVVQTIMMGCLNGASSPIPIVLRRGNGPLEALVGCEHRFEAWPVRDARIRIDWVREGGRQMCRVARTMPDDT